MRRSATPIRKYKTKEDLNLVLVEESLPHLMRHVSRRMFKALQVDLHKHQITSSIWYFLRVLWNQEGLNQAELSQRVGLMTPTTTSTLNNMERAGLIVRQQHPTDKRKYLIYLTQKGREIRPGLLRAAIDVHKRATDGLTREQIEQFRKTIHTIERNLDEMLGDKGDLVDASLELDE